MQVMVPLLYKNERINITFNRFSYFIVSFWLKFNWTLSVFDKTSGVILCKLNSGDY